jgi:hypothetical protein
VGWLKGGTRAWNGGSEGKASLTCAVGGLPLALAGFCERGEGERLVSGGRETRYGWQGVAPAVHAGKWERSALVAVGMEWVARAGGPIARAGAGTCGRGDARPKSRLEGAEAGVQGRRVRVRSWVGRGELGANKRHARGCLAQRKRAGSREAPRLLFPET